MCCEKDLSYEEAKQLCQMAFDAGVDYHSTCAQFNCNAVAYDWEHWLKRNESLFRRKPTVEDVLREFAANIADVLGGDDFKLDDNDELYAEFAARLRLAGDAE